MPLGRYYSRFLSNRYILRGGADARAEAGLDTPGSPATRVKRLVASAAEGYANG